MTSSTEDVKVIMAASDSKVPSTLVTAPETGHVFVDDLPVELVTRILCFANDTSAGTNKDITFPYTALLVSKRWHEIALTTPELWTTVNVDFTRTSDKLGGLARHSIRSRNRALHLDVTMGRPGGPDWFFIFRSQSADNKKWKSLRIRGSGAVVVTLVRGASAHMSGRGRCLTSLETLVLVEQERPRMFDGYRGIPGVGRALPDLLRDLTTLTRLHTHHISLDHCGKWPTPGETFSVTSSLRELVIEGASLEAVLLFSWVDFPMLQTLGIQCEQREGSTIGTHQFIHLGIKLPALKSVILYDVDPASASTILASGPDIRFLAISHTESTQALQSLSDHKICPKLTDLIVHGTMEPWLSEVVKERLPTLKRLSLDAGVAEDTEVAGSAAMSWLRAHVEVELLKEGEMEFSEICRRFSPTVL